MNQAKQNKAFILEYYNAVSGVPKTTELLQHYITDQALIDHITFFEKKLPKQLRMGRVSALTF